MGKGYIVWGRDRAQGELLIVWWYNLEVGGSLPTSLCNDLVWWSANEDTPQRSCMHRRATLPCTCF
jgi:hypothetical protein